MQECPPISLPLTFAQANTYLGADDTSHDFPSFFLAAFVCGVVILRHPHHVGWSLRQLLKKVLRLARVADVCDKPSGAADASLREMVCIQHRENDPRAVPRRKRGAVPRRKQGLKSCTRIV